MARSEGRLQFGIWREGLDGLSPHAKLLYCVLLTEPTVNHAGVGAWRPSRWARNASLTLSEAEKALDELSAGEPVTARLLVDEDTEEVLVRTLIRNDQVADQPYVLKSALTSALAVQSSLLRWVLAQELRKLPPKKPDTVSPKTKRLITYPDPHAAADLLDPPGARPPGRLPEPSAEGLERVSEGSPNPPLEKGLEREGGGGGGSGSSSVGTSSSSVVPRKRGTRIPEGFAHTHITAELVAWVRDRCPDVDGPRETERFVLWAESTSGSKGVKLDWVKTWKNWLLEEQKRIEQRRPAHLRVVAPRPVALPVALPVDAQAAFADLRNRADAKTAADLIGIAWVEPAQRPSDPTPYPQWSRARRLDFIDEHREAICAALTARRTG